MKAYMFDEKTKEFIGEIEAQIDPLESQKAGKDIWLLPANASFELPLEPKENNKIIFDNGWKYEPIPEPEPEPQPTEEEMAERKRADRNRLLDDSDKRMLPDFPISAEEKELWLLYRQYLRDITKDPAFPNVDVLSFANWLGQIHSKEPVLGA